MGFVNKRPGFTTQVGATNPKVFVSDIPPKSPKDKMIWVNKLSGELKTWDVVLDAWVPATVVNQRTNTPVLIWIGSAAQYAAIVTKDDNTVYFVPA